MKKNKIIIFCIFTMFFALMVQPVFAQSEAWIVNDSGQKTTEYGIVETGSDIDLGKIRLREDNYTLGKLKVGDRITLVLRNATFKEAPLVLDPVPTLDNPLGSSGYFELVRVPGTGRNGDNAVVYELERKTRYFGNYNNLDYVFHFANIKAEKEGDVFVNIFGGTQDDTIKGSIISHQEILLAKVYDIIPESIIRTKLLEHEIISRELNAVFQAGDYYRYSNSSMAFEVPELFFERGDMLSTLSGERWTFKIQVNNVSGMKVGNPEYSQEIGLPVREIMFFKKDGFGEYPDFLAQRDFEPIKVTFKNLNPTSAETSNFFPVKYVKTAEGKYIKEIAGSGSFDIQNKEYTFYANGPGIYSIEKRDAVKIIMRVGNSFASVNNLQERLEVAPVIIDNLTYVPIRFIAEKLGAQIEFFASTNQVQIKTMDKVIYLPIDQITEDLSAPARIIDGRTMVPVRYVSEQLGAIVNYFADARRIEIVK